MRGCEGESQIRAKQKARICATHPSLRGVANAETIQKNKINPHEVRILAKVFASFCFCKK